MATPGYMGPALDAYGRSQGWTSSQVTDWLGCSPVNVPALKNYVRPSPSSGRFDAETERLSRSVGCDLARLRTLIQEVDRIEEDERRRREEEERRRREEEERRIREQQRDNRQLTSCRACRKPVSRSAYSCPHCGHPLRDRGPTGGPNFLAALLSFLLPGLGQLVKGDFGTVAFIWGAYIAIVFLNFYLIFNVGFFFFLLMGFVSFALWVWQIYDAGWG